MHKQPYFTVIGISPAFSGFGFAVIEPNRRLVAWGVARLYSKSEEEFQQRLDAICEKYRVRVICAENTADSRRGVRARRMIQIATSFAKTGGRQVTHLSAIEVRRQVGLDMTLSKHAVATRLAEAFPELETVLPEPRKPWASEDRRMRIFEAVGLAIACLSHNQKGDSPFRC
jgi:hypothetical protein